MADTFSTVRVQLSERSYDIIVGPGVLASLPLLLSKTPSIRRVIIITDSTVEPLYAPALTSTLTAEGLKVDTLAIPAGKQSKQFLVFIIYLICRME